MAPRRHVAGGRFLGQLSVAADPASGLEPAAMMAGCVGSLAESRASYKLRLVCRASSSPPARPACARP